ncbi:SAM-dependent methyltransferase [Terrabacter terrigena]|uniref:SAM-dependent methyltransferase n=1 Tax=Terrabacter terrigena TaxID=574718 RepID=A0ABW3MX12_9MICO
MDPVPWREAWHDALYAAGRGFYLERGGPAAHFTTAAHGPTGRVLAEALLRLWQDEHGATLPAVVVDVGAGRGELATHLVAALSEAAGPRCAVAPGREQPPGPQEGEAASHLHVRVVAVDVVGRPAGLDPRIEWLRSPGGSDLPAELAGLENALVVAHEWLDVVPCTVAEVDPAGQLREVLVHPATGDESLGGPVADADRAWASAQWPGTEPGDRVEVGLARDRAWAGLAARVGSGTVVAVDYGHTATERPHHGTLTAYARGTVTHPVPDGSCDVTAHVAMDSLDADELHRQRDLLQGLGFTGARPDHALASSDPLGYLRALERAGAEAELTRRGGFGDFWWAVKRIGRPDVP